MSALLTVFERMLPAIVIIFIALFLVWIGYIVLSHLFRGATDEVQKTTIDNADWLEAKFKSKLSDEELNVIAQYIAKSEDDVDLD